MNIFQKIINKEINADIIYEDDRIIAFKDIKPKREGHFLVVPKKYSQNLIDIDEETYIYLMLKSKELANKIIKEMHVSGFNLEINNGAESGQEIFHTHIHIIPTKK